MEKRYLVYVSQQSADTGGHGWGIRLEDIPLMEKTMPDIISNIVGIYKNFERVEKMIKENDRLCYQEIEWEA